MAFADSKVTLPKTIGVWRRPEKTLVVDKQNIFEYMDGAGELYLGYRFKRLDAFEYSAPDEYGILVELYQMQSPDDAFGLLSLDWSGEEVKSGDQAIEPPVELIPSSRALYGAGLLRLCFDKYYARIMAYQETPASREAVLALGEKMVPNHQHPAPPVLLSAVPATIPPHFQIQKQRTSYFRSHLVFNSIYYLSSENILDLDLSTEAVYASYFAAGDSSGSFKLLIIRYSDAMNAGKALRHFQDAYLPQADVSLVRETSGSVKIEDGWVGYHLSGVFLLLVFEVPTQNIIQSIFEQVSLKITKLEDE